MGLIVAFLLAIVSLQILILYMLYYLFRFSMLYSKGYREYQRERVDALAEYRKYVEECQASIVRQKELEEQYRRDIEEDKNKRQKAYAQYEKEKVEYEKQSREWDKLFERFKAFIDESEKRQ